LKRHSEKLVRIHCDAIRLQREDPQKRQAEERDGTYQIYAIEVMSICSREDKRATPTPIDVNPAVVFFAKSCNLTNWVESPLDFDCSEYLIEAATE
jgi:hypothetical protein